jgi:DNA-directed RNA polymerase beta subunit
MEMMSAKSDDIHKRRFTYNALISSRQQQINLQSSQSESFNLLLQYLRGIGFDLQATDYNDKEIDFYQYFSRYK